MASKKCTGFLQALNVVTPEEEYDLEVYGMRYTFPKSGMSPVIESCYGTYKYNFTTKEMILLSEDGKEVIRKQVDPKSLAKSEYRWLRLAKEEARIKLGLDDCCY